MRISFGKHKHALLERILLTEPGYIAWIITEPEPDWKLLILREEAIRLSRILDRLPMRSKCRSHGCSNVATWLAVPDDGSEIGAWCDGCWIESTCFYRTPCDVIRDYETALNREKQYRKGFFKPVTPLLALAYAKGLKNPFDDADLEAFFRDDKENQKSQPESMLSKAIYAAGEIPLVFSL